MSKKPHIVIPDTSKKANAGLIIVGGFRYATYKVDGLQKRRKLGAETGSVALQRVVRDAFYKELLADGATVALTRGPKAISTKGRRERAAADPMKYIGHNPKVTSAPWFVRLDGKIIGRYGTEAEARKARNSKLGVA